MLLACALPLSNDLSLRADASRARQPHASSVFLVHLLVSLARDAHLPVPQVCRGWRSLRAEEELWRRIDVSYVQGSYSWGRQAIFTDKGLAAFLVPGPRSPIPSADVVQDLSIYGDKARRMSLALCPKR